MSLRVVFFYLEQILNWFMVALPELPENKPNHEYFAVSQTGNCSNHPHDDDRHHHIASLLFYGRVEGRNILAFVNVKVENRAA